MSSDKPRETARQLRGVAQIVRDEMAGVVPDEIDLLAEQVESLAAPETQPPHHPELHSEICACLSATGRPPSRAQLEKWRDMVSGETVQPGESVAEVVRRLQAEAKMALQRLAEANTDAVEEHLREITHPVHISRASVGPAEIVIAVSPDGKYALASARWRKTQRLANERWGDYSLIERVPVHGAQPKQEGGECCEKEVSEEQDWWVKQYRAVKAERDELRRKLAIEEEQKHEAMKQAYEFTREIDGLEHKLEGQERRVDALKHIRDEVACWFDAEDDDTYARMVEILTAAINALNPWLSASPQPESTEQDEPTWYEVEEWIADNTLCIKCGRPAEYNDGLMHHKCEKQKRNEARHDGRETNIGTSGDGAESTSDRSRGDGAGPGENESGGGTEGALGDDGQGQAEATRVGTEQDDRGKEMRDECKSCGLLQACLTQGPLGQAKKHCPMDTKQDDRGERVTLG
jgi:hypothetical protein